jgi:hypothetical protein
MVFSVMPIIKCTFELFSVVGSSWLVAVAATLAGWQKCNGDALEKCSVRKMGKV